MPELDVVMKDIEPFKALYLRFQLAPATLRQGLNEMLHMVAERGIHLSSPRIDVIFGDEINIDDEAVEWAFVLPVDDSVTDDLKLPTVGTMILLKCHLPKPQQSCFMARPPVR